VSRHVAVGINLGEGGGQRGNSAVITPKDGGDVYVQCGVISQAGSCKLLEDSKIGEGLHCLGRLVAAPLRDASGRLHWTGC